MGCDIHIVLEKKHKDKWVGIRDFQYFNRTMLNEDFPQDGWRYIGFRLKQRNYNLFADLAGVRGDPSEIGFDARGFPDDASDLSRMRVSDDDPDLHSHSWLTLAEVEPILKKHFAPFLVKEKINGKDHDVLVALVDESIDSEENPNLDGWRLVLAFDN